jgi:hypothetical protein
MTNISKNKMSDLNTNLITTVEKFSEVFEFVQYECISLKKTYISFWNTL